MKRFQAIMVLLASYALAGLALLGAFLATCVMCFFLFAVARGLFGPPPTPAEQQAAKELLIFALTNSPAGTNN